MPMPAATRSSSWWPGNPIVRLAPNCVARATASGVALRPAPARTQATSGSAIPGSKQIVLCESAIDAISCFQLHTQLDGGTTSRGVHLHLDGGSSPGRALASSALGTRLRHLLWLRRRRAWRDGQSPDDHPPSLDPTPAAASARLERRANHPASIKHRHLPIRAPVPQSQFPHHYLLRNARLLGRECRLELYQSGKDAGRGKAIA